MKITKRLVSILLAVTLLLSLCLPATAHETESTEESTEPVKTIYVAMDWKDQVSHGHAPTVVSLMADGQYTGLTASLEFEKDYKACFTDLPVYNEEGKEILYQVIEPYGIPGYTYIAKEETYDTEGYGWEQVDTFEKGGTYLIATGDRVLGVDEENNLTLSTDAREALSFKPQGQNYLWTAWNPNEPDAGNYLASVTGGSLKFMSEYPGFVPSYEYVLLQSFVVEDGNILKTGDSYPTRYFTAVVDGVGKYSESKDEACSIALYKWSYQGEEPETEESWMIYSLRERDSRTVSIPVELNWVRLPEPWESDTVEASLYLAHYDRADSPAVRIADGILGAGNDWSVVFEGYPAVENGCYYIRVGGEDFRADYHSKETLIHPSGKGTLTASKAEVVYDGLFFDFREDNSADWTQDTGGDEFFPHDAPEPYVEAGCLILSATAQYGTQVYYKGEPDYTLKPTDRFEIGVTPMVTSYYSDGALVLHLTVDGEEHSIPVDLIRGYDEKYQVLTTDELGLSGKLESFGFYIDGNNLRGSVCIDYMALTTMDPSVVSYDKVLVDVQNLPEVLCLDFEGEQASLDDWIISCGTDGTGSIVRPTPKKYLENGDLVVTNLYNVETEVVYSRDNFYKVKSTDVFATAMKFSGATEGSTAAVELLLKIDGVTRKISLGTADSTEGQVQIFSTDSLGLSGKPESIGLRIYSKDLHAESVSLEYLYLGSYALAPLTIPVEKQWDEMVPEAYRTPVEMELLVYNKTGNWSNKKEVAQVVDTLTLNEENNWSGIFTGIPKLTNGTYYLREKETDLVVSYNLPERSVLTSEGTRTAVRLNPVYDGLYFGFDEEQKPAAGWMQDTGGDEFFPHKADDPYISKGELVIPGSLKYRTTVDYAVNYEIKATDRFEIGLRAVIPTFRSMGEIQLRLQIDGVLHTVDLGLINVYSDIYHTFTTKALGLSGKLEKIGLYIDGAELLGTVYVDYLSLTTVRELPTCEKLTVTNRMNMSALEEYDGHGNIYIKSVGEVDASKKIFLAYRLLDAKLYVDQAGNIVTERYRVPVELKDFYAQRYGLDPMSETFARDVIAHIQAEDAQVLLSAVAEAGGLQPYTGKALEEEFSITNLPLGWYLVEDATTLGEFVTPRYPVTLVFTNPDAVLDEESINADWVNEVTATPIDTLRFDFEETQSPAKDWVLYCGDKEAEEKLRIQDGYLVAKSPEWLLYANMEYTGRTNYIIDPMDCFEISLRVYQNFSFDIWSDEPCDMELWITVDGELHKINVGKVIPYTGSYQLLTTPALGLRGRVEKISVYFSGVNMTVNELKIDHIAFVDVMDCAPAYEFDGSITVNYTEDQAGREEEFTAWRLLDAVVYVNFQGDTVRIRYSVPEELQDFFAARYKLDVVDPEFATKVLDCLLAEEDLSAVLEVARQTEAYTGTAYKDNYYFGSLHPGVYLVGENAGLTAPMLAQATPFAVLREVEAKEWSQWTLNHTLDLAGDISVNYAIPVSAMQGFDMAYAYLNVTVPEYDGDSLTYYHEKILPELRGNYYYFTLKGLTAVQMNDLLTASLYCKGFDGHSYKSPEDEYSIATYALAQLNKEGVSEALKTLCANLLRYGAAAQEYKGYRTDFLADAEMTAQNKSYLTPLSSVTFQNNYMEILKPDKESFAWVAKGLDLNTRVALTFRIEKLDANLNDDDWQICVEYIDIDGVRQSHIVPASAITNSGMLYTFRVDCLDASELRNTVSITICDMGGQSLSKTLIYSADTYGVNKTGELKDLCKALFAYSDSAKAFFAN